MTAPLRRLPCSIADRTPTASARAARWLLALAAVCTLGCAKEVAGPHTGDEEKPITYTFGAKYEPPEGRVVHGLGQWEVYNAKYVALLPAELQPAAQLIFVDIGDTPRGWRPHNLAALLDSYDQRGLIPNVDIALRGLQPGVGVLDTLSDPLYGIDDEIANTTDYDARITDVIEVVRAYGKPVMLRIGGEFSGPWNGYHPYEFPRAFRKIVSMFRSAGVDNVAFIWCFEPASPDDFDVQDATGAYKWFPGDDVIDWYSVDLFSAGALEPSGAGRNASPQYDKVIRFLDMAVAHGKPVIIAESAPAYFDFTVAGGAQAAWDDWFVPYFALIAKRPEIKWFHYINYDWTQASSYLANGWKNNDLSASEFLAQRYIAEVSKAKYLHANEKNLLLGFE